MRSPPPRHAHRGFTLTELLIALSVAGILVGMAAPSFRELIVGSQQDSRLYALLGDLQYARSESIKRASRVALCARAAGTPDECGTEWSNGWLVFVDTGDTPGVFEPANDGELLRTADNLPTTLALDARARIASGVEAANPRGFVRFGPRGTSNWRGGGTFLLCGSSGTADERNTTSVGVNVSLAGEVRRGRRDGDGALIDAFGQAASCVPAAEPV